MKAAHCCSEGFVTITSVQSKNNSVRYRYDAEMIDDKGEDRISGV